MALHGQVDFVIENNDQDNSNKRFYLSISDPDTCPVADIQAVGEEGRAMSKTLSFALVHFTVAFTVGWLMSGSMLVGGAIALVEPVVNTVAYHFHERFWNRLRKAGPVAARRLA
jgi:uncharacterized membrane protein